jgi:predicted phosphodiesterase
VRIAVISDIHSNLPALQAVLADIEDREPDEVWCLGDVVGYGAHPDECTAIVAEQTELCLAGNHDLVVVGQIDIEYFALDAGEAARWTAEIISPETRSFLDGLRPAERHLDLGLYHASPRDPIWEYVLSIEQAAECIDVQEERVCMIGHSHVACCFWREDSQTDGATAPDRAVLEIEEGEWLINPGSVGQPRDGDPRASYLMLDIDAWTASFHRVEYPIDEAAAAIVDAGLPRQLAERLYAGH